MNLESEAAPLINKPHSKLSKHNLHKTYFYVIFSLLIFLGAFFTLYFRDYILFVNQSPNVLRKLPNGSRIHLSSSKYNRYIRLSSTSLVLTETIPWKHGSTFEVYNEERCFRLRSMTQKWIYVDKNTKSISANTIEQNDGTLFEIISYSNNNNNELNHLILLKLCTEDNYIEVVEEFVAGMTPNDGSSSYLKLSIKSSLERATTTMSPTTTTINQNQRSLRNPFMKQLLGLPFDWFSQISTTNKQTISSSNSNDNNKHKDDLAGVFKVSIVSHIEGVNLGGWFIPEIWMTPAFSSWTGLGWAGTLCKVTHYDTVEAERRMDEHLKTWITEEDFKQISSNGFNSVRLPVGYWSLIPDPYNKFVPKDTSMSISYIDWTFDMAEKYGLTVLLDLHGVPGSQNGIDHSGCANGTRWLEERMNIDLYLETIRFMASRYSSRKNLIGFELANEPSKDYSEKNHNMLISLYKQAYMIIRQHHKECDIVFNELYERVYTNWTSVLHEPLFYNVVMDVHLYNWQEPYTKQNASTHVMNAIAWSGMLDQLSLHHPVVVGEWCFSTGTYVQAGQEFVDACVNSFDRAIGWYLWNWKIQKDIHFDEWNVQLQYQNPNGMRINRNSISIS